MDMKASLKALGWIFLGMRGPLGMPSLVCPFVRPPEKFNWHKGVADAAASLEMLPHLKTNMGGILKLES